ncbi:MAG: cystathionine gamma-synthase [Bdellovibrionales bacterium CG12_big_fil_rev_8_21_14_0_65_38_15]|nr:MAG: cystathionine gamma-synthase [Bdellovibrionales bacterium CG22_combo_CG10-13_8_21_14_all_38_13]PIQ54520.1 MAG: cystathionine gamma-synthase [Bdellovibrionales bacterium CG12_big_fil_rev_8_21_14_0_65_38_15]PIR29901.1 MAG: cystathionine gamma-synthase [Bdellovibrionales bacterium CG11_big_fil_rev_8_21_14_0_20_38_13]
MAKSKKQSKQSFDTRTIHVGGEPDPVTGAIMPPIFQTSTFVQKAPGVHQGYEYTRSHNPTRTRLEECLASLENAKFATVTASGLSAAMLVMHHLPKGSKILVGDDVYGGTYRMFTTIFHERHNFKFIDTTDLKKTEAEIKKFKPAMVWLESPTNPLLKLSDIAGISKAAKKANALVLVDNTFMSPYFQNPLDLGADMVLHSMTKYINGHSDVVGGVLMYNDKKMNQDFFRLQNSIGPAQSPFDSWLVLRGLKTLAVRMRAHEQGAIKIAKWLENHKQVERVVYPGLASHPQHKLAKKQMSGFGGMITFFIKGGVKESKKFLQGLELFALAESLGGVESLVEHPAIMTHASVPKKVRESIGLSDNLIRLSVGLEDVNDLIADLENGFNKK